MLKIVYPNCCGIDVHKTFIVAVIAITDNHGITSYHRKRFSTFTNGLLQLRDWLEYYSCFDVCMESTGKYWIPVFNILEEHTNIYLAHPKYVKAIRGKKTDKKDAQWIADLFKHDLVASSFIPPLKIRQLRDLFRYRMKLCELHAVARKIVTRTASLGLTSRLQVSFPMFLERVLKRLLEASLTIQTRNQTLNSLFTRE